MSDSHPVPLPQPGWVDQVSDDLAWVDDTSFEELLTLLAQVGSPVPTREGGLARDDILQIAPLEEDWLALRLLDGRLTATPVESPGSRNEIVGDQYFLDEDAEDLVGWVRARADFDASGRRWLSVVRRPEREAYAAIVYDSDGLEPHRRLVVSGVYPDAILCDGGRRIAFVEPDREARGFVRLVVATADADDYEASRTIVARTEGGAQILPCAARRYVKFGLGPRTRRSWGVLDAGLTPPREVPVPGLRPDPARIDVGTLAGRHVFVHVTENEGRWRVHTTPLTDLGEVEQSSVCASGRGSVLGVRAGDGYAVLRVVFDGGAESLVRVPLTGFTSPGHMLAASTGRLDISSNTVSPAVGLCATERLGGVQPFTWYWRPSGDIINGREAAAFVSARPRRGMMTAVSADGYETQMDLRWAAQHGDTFTGPVLLMVYGAYGLDLDLDTDPDLGRWLERGYAVGTPYLRGGGDEVRHCAATASRRGNSLADLTACIRRLRDPEPPVRATQLAVIGASAGGFLAATALNSCPELVDAAVIVNGFVDPMPSLLTGNSPTIASDWDEWGNPLVSEDDYRTLRRVSPYENLVDAGAAKALVIVSGCDVRVNPRQGLKWAMRYRQLGGRADVWYDPEGSHDCWGEGSDITDLVDWFDEALGRVSVGR